MAVTSIAFLADDRRLAIGYRDGSVGIFSSDGSLLCTLFAFKNGDWAVVTPDFRFDTNDLRGGLPLHWIFPDQPLHPLPLELFMRECYEPKLLSRVLSGEKLTPIKSIQALNRLQPEVQITRITPDANGERVSVEVEVAQTFGSGDARSQASLLQLL